VFFNSVNSGALFSVSPAGHMIYYPAPIDKHMSLSWYDRDGKRGDSLDIDGSADQVALSPDGTRAVVNIYSPDRLSSDLWNFDLGRGTKTRLTSSPELKTRPVWLPDGQFVLFSAGIPQHIYRSRSDGSGGIETVVSDQQAIPSSVCHDASYLAYEAFVAPSWSIWVLPFTGDRRPFVLVQSKFQNWQPKFSPDCKWIAYGSDATGRYEIYITHFPDATGVYQVSTQSGGPPRWRSDGKELFYYSYDQNNMMAVNVEEKNQEILLGNPRELFHLANQPIAFDVTPDGRRFLISTSNYQSVPVPLTLVTNWEAELKKK
jgi:eukaryotic-like serine/threonine-protein kinase